MKKPFSLLGVAALLIAAVSLFGATPAPQARITLVERNAAPGAQPNAQASVVRRSMPGGPDREAYRFAQLVRFGSPVTEMVEVAFHAPTTLTKIEASNDFHTAGGTCQIHHLYNPGQTCVVDVTLEPKGPGNRAGLLTFLSAESATPDVVGLQGSTLGAALSFIPAQINTVPQTVKPNGNGLIFSEGDVVVDQGDNLYFSDLGGLGSSGGLVYSIDSSGGLQILGGQGNTELTVANPTLPVASLALHFPSGLAVDQFLMVAVAEAGNNSIDLLGGMEGYLWLGLGGDPASGCTPSSECLGTTVYLQMPISVKVDQVNNLFLTDNAGYYETNGYLFAPSLFQLKNVGSSGADLYANASFGLDGADNMYGESPEYAGTGCQIYGVNPTTGVTWNVAGSGICGASGNNVRAQSAEINTPIWGYGFDAAGDMYFADSKNNEVRRVDSYNGLIRTVAGTAVNASTTCNYNGDGGPATDAALCSPDGAAVDSNGVLYTQTSDGTKIDDFLIRQVGPAGQRNFPITLVGKSSSVMTVLLTNTGNDDLAVSNQIMTGNSGDFAMDPATTSCVWTTPLKSGRSCQLGYSFRPTAAGTRSATVTFVDNTASFQNTLYLNGYALATPAPTTTTIIAPVATAYIAGINIPGSATVSSNVANLNPTGAVAFTLWDTTKNMVEASFQASLSPGSKSSSSSTASFTIPGLGPDTYKLQASYSGDTLDAASTATPVTFAVSQVTPQVNIAAPTSGSAFLPGQAIATMVMVTNSGTTPTPPGSPTGTVTLSYVNGSSPAVIVGPVTLSPQTGPSNGVSIASIPNPIPSIQAGNWTVSAAYSGDTADAAASSAAVPFTVAKVTPVVTINNPASGSSYIAGGQVSTKVTVSNAGTTPKPSGAPTGTVTLTFAQGSATFPEGPFTLTPGSNGVSTVSVANPISSPVPGNWTVKATYNGDAVDASVATVPIPFTVAQVTPTVTITSPGSGFAFVPDAAIATAVSVSNAGKTPTPTGAPTGSVTLTYVNGSNAPIKVGPLTLTAGLNGISTASIANPITGIQAGNWTVSAAYAGDTPDAPASSAAVPFTVSQVTPTVQLLTPTARSYTYGTSIPLQAQVSNYGLHPTDPNSPSGLVTFKLTNKTTNATQSIGGYALFNYSTGVSRTPSTVSLTSLAAAQYSVYAIYGGDAADAPVNSTTVTFTVMPASSVTVKTTTLLASAQNPARKGQTVVVNATVKPASGTTTPTGSVALFENGKTIAATQLGSGMATLSLKGLSVGTHTLTATYAGDQRHQSSISQPLQQIVVTINPAMPVPPGLGGRER